MRPLVVLLSGIILMTSSGITAGTVIFPNQSTPSLDFVDAPTYKILNDSMNRPTSILFTQKVNIVTTGLFNVRGLMPSVTFWNNTSNDGFGTITTDKYINFTKTGSNNIDVIWGLGKIYNKTNVDYSLSNLNLTFHLFLFPVDKDLVELSPQVSSQSVTVVFMNYADYNIQNVRHFDIFTNSYYKLSNVGTATFEVGDSFEYEAFNLDQTDPPLYNPLGLGMNAETDSTYNLTITELGTSSNSMYVDIFNTTNSWNHVLSGMPFSYLFISPTNDTDTVKSLMFSLVSDELGGMIQNHGNFTKTSSSNDSYVELRVNTYFNLIDTYDFYQNYTVVYNLKWGIMTQYTIDSLIVSNTNYEITYGYVLKNINSKLSRLYPMSSSHSSSISTSVSTSDTSSTPTENSGSPSFLPFGFIAPLFALIVRKRRRIHIND